MINMLDMTSSYLYCMSMMGSTWLKNTMEALRVTSELMTKIPQLEVAPGKHNGDISKLQEDFISTVDHELRNPLTSIRALSSILHDNPDLDVNQREKYLDIITQESEKLTHAVEEVLDLAELELGSVVWHLSEVDLKTVIEEAVTTVSRRLEQKRIELQVRLPEQVPLMVADRKRLLQVMLSLLSNAIRFCDSASGWIGIRLQVTDDFLQVDVSDNGSRLSNVNRPIVIDEACHPLGNISIAEAQTTSLGLLISRCIIAHFGGRLWVEDELKHGAKFCFTLPLETGAA